VISNCGEMGRYIGCLDKIEFNLTQSNVVHFGFKSIVNLSIKLVFLRTYI